MNGEDETVVVKLVDKTQGNNNHVIRVVS